MNPETMKQLLDYLDKLGAKLGVGTQMVWPWFVRQVYIDAVVAWGFFIFISSILWLTTRYTLSHWRPRDDKGDNREDIYNIYTNDHEGFWIFALVALSILTLIGIICVLLSGFDWLNPEYWALKSLLSTVKPK